MLSEYEVGLLMGFLRSAMTEAQKEIIYQFYPELISPLGLKHPSQLEVPSRLVEEMRVSCYNGRRIEAIKNLRQWASEAAGRDGNGYPKHPLASLKAAKEYIDNHFPPG